MVRPSRMFGLTIHFLWITSMRAINCNNLDTCDAKNETVWKQKYYKETQRRQFLRQDKLNLTNTYFVTLDNYETGAVQVSETKYPWIARVLHAKTRKDTPHFCTAACVEDGIFITAARCISTLKVKYTTIKYNNQFLDVKAFVIPKNPTKQQFDDVGIIIVQMNSYTGSDWPYITSIGYYHNRSDEVFKWWLKVGPMTLKAIGYARKKGSVKDPNTKYTLTELDVLGGINMCQIYTIRANFTGFNVICYFGCPYEDYEAYTNPNCKNYHGVEGGAVYCSKYNRLLGVASWGGYWDGTELPVGFAIPNSKNYYKNLGCAIKLRDDKATEITAGYYQGLCN